MSLEEIRDSGIEILTTKDALRGLACSACASACVLAIGELAGDASWRRGTAFAAYVASISAFIAGAAYAQLSEFRFSLVASPRVRSDEKLS